MISVLIASRNRAPLLADTLQSLQAQQWPGEPYEIVIADNASTDRTPDIVADAARRSTVPVVYVREARDGKSHALNTAITHARGDVLVLTDDDVLPCSGWLSAYAAAFRDPGIDFVVGRVLPLWEASPPVWLSPELYGVLAVPDGGTRRLTISRGLNDAIMPLGANMAIRRHVVDRVGGWNPDLGKLQGTLRTGEDHEFALKMLQAGFVGVYEPLAAAQHRVPAERMRLAYFRQWFYENGAIEAGLEQDFPTTAQYLFNVPRHLWRELVSNLVQMIGGVLTWNAKRATAGEMRLIWFAGYVRARWRSSRGSPRRQTHSAAAPRS